MYNMDKLHWRRVGFIPRAKAQNILKMHIIEITAPIPTKFCKVKKDHQILFVGGPSTSKTIQDGGRPPFEKKIR